MFFEQRKGQSPGTRPEQIYAGEAKTMFETLGNMLESGNLTQDTLDNAYFGKERLISDVHYRFLNRELHKREVKTLQDQLVKLDIEPTTGLLTRKRMDSDIPKKIAELYRSQEKKGMLFFFFDIDYFKQFNDKYGHQAGDQVLSIVGDRLRGIGHRSGDSAYRYGGEEVVLVLELNGDFSEKEIQEFVESKRRELNNSLFIEVTNRDGTKEKIPIVLSVGAAYLPKNAENEKEIAMEFINGKRISECLNSFSKIRQLKICGQIGREVAKLHDLNIIHGDLTTSNMILKKSEIYFIDFGLGFISHKPEDKAVDLHLLREALEAKHFENWELLINEVFENYKKSKDSKIVFERLKKVEKRGRYKH